MWGHGECMLWGWGDAGHGRMRAGGTGRGVHVAGPWGHTPWVDAHHIAGGGVVHTMGDACCRVWGVQTAGDACCGARGCTSWGWGMHTIGEHMLQQFWGGGCVCVHAVGGHGRHTMGLGAACRGGGLPADPKSGMWGMLQSRPVSGSWRRFRSKKQPKKSRVSGVGVPGPLFPGRAPHGQAGDEDEDGGGVSRTGCVCVGSYRFPAGTFIPSCDEDGYYRRAQCEPGGGECWCVDQHGAELTGTRGRGSPDCGECRGGGGKAPCPGERGCSPRTRPQTSLPLAPYRGGGGVFGRLREQRGLGGRGGEGAGGGGRGRRGRGGRSGRGRRRRLHLVEEQESPASGTAGQQPPSRGSL